MLIEFKIGNFRSFKEIVTLSMAASADKEYLETHTFPIDKKLRLVKSAALYGANASGKSNLFQAMTFMKYFVISSSKEGQATEAIPVEKFRLSSETEGEPSTFEVIFIMDNIRYRYGFQLDSERVHNEWLFHVPTTREATLFTREQGKIKWSPHFKEGKGLEEKTRENALFLSVAAQFNGKISGKILEWFHNINIISGLEDLEQKNFTIAKLDNKDFKEFTVKFLKVADMGIKAIEKEVKSEGKSIEINTFHQKFDTNHHPVSDEKFNLVQHESSGTKALFAFSAPIYDTLKTNKVLFIDELTSKLHPVLARAIIKIFHNYNSGKDRKNQSKAQLIFVGHDTNILSNQFFRRDQIWFTQKDQYGATDLYSLEEYRVRKDASFNKDYIMGKYGAIPLIGDIESLFNT